MFRRLFIAGLLAFLTISSVLAQSNSSAFQSYINQYHTLAQQHMQKYKIPASITLAQGLLESAAGRSTLAVKANNHFGIKVSGDWTGPYVLRSDDRPDDKFRKYNSPEESYEDHAKFLLKPRYAQLFQLDITDYKGWAKGLKACGYATSPTYAESLITIIENWKLHQYDVTQKSHHQGANAAKEDFFDTHAVGYCNKNYYIVVRKGDTLKQIAKATGVSQKKLLKYNDLPSDYQIQPGNILFLEKKQKKADKSMYGVVYTVTQGQSMYDISQLFGMRLSSLYELNHLDADYIPKAGDFLRVY